MRQFIEQLHSPDPAVSRAARERLQFSRVTTAEQAQAVLEALSRESPGPRTGSDTPESILLRLIQQPAGQEAMEYFRPRASPVILAAWPRLSGQDRTLALMVLARIGAREGLEFVARTVAAPDGPQGLSVAVILEDIPVESPHVEVLFPTLTPLLDGEDSRALEVLNLANRLVAARRLWPHPVATRLPRLRRYIESESENDYGPALAACYALALIPGAEALELLELATQHPDPEVRLEALYARSRQGVPGAVEALAQATLDPLMALRAREYLKELGKAHLRPKEADDPVLLAKAEMISWLRHPNEFGEEPESIELWDRRVLDWPPTGDRRELFLFRYRYPFYVYGQDEQTEEGVGLVGSVTFSLTGDTKPPPEGTPEDAYVAHCLWELRQEGDPRGEALTPEQARALLGFPAKVLN
jgi:HEAT repeat protein